MNPFEAHQALILVVERDPHVRELEAYFLEEAGYSVEFATDGLSALERTREIHPDILITEILVPKLDGLALCRKLKADVATRDIAVLVFSIMMAAERAREAGADAFLRKPLVESRLVDTVRELIAALSRGAIEGERMIEVRADEPGYGRGPKAMGEEEKLFDRVSTGNPQADQILGGGFPANSINVIMGQPGTGKTIFAEQLVFHNADDGRPIVYLMTLSEPLTKAVRYLQGFRFFDEAKLGSAVVYDDVGADVAEHGIGALVVRLKETIKTISPKILVIDSFKALHDLSESVSETRRLIYEITGLLTAYGTTAFLLGEYNEEDIQRYPEFATADGIVELSRRKLGTRDERYFRVMKLRGSRYLEGAHAFGIGESGLEIHPRLVSPLIPEDYEPSLERVSTGVEELDSMTSGGFWRGSATLLAGPSGSGKTTLGLQFALEGARQGEPSLYVNFQENPSQLARTIRGLGVDLEEMKNRGLELIYVSPVELQIDSIVKELFLRIEGNGIQRLVIDAIGDLAASASDPDRLRDYLYALVQHFGVKGVTSMLTFETLGHALTGDRLNMGSVSYMCDNLLLLEMTGRKETRRTIRVLKTRGSVHATQVRDFSIDAEGVRIK